MDRTFSPSIALPDPQDAGQLSNRKVSGRHFSYTPPFRFHFMALSFDPLGSS